MNMQLNSANSGFSYFLNHPSLIQGFSSSLIHLPLPMLFVNERVYLLNQYLKQRANLLILLNR